MASRLTTFIVVLIVAGTLIAGLIVGAQRDDMDGPVDLIITNGRVYTGSDTTFAEAIAVRGNKILRVGTNREIKRLRRRQTVALDAHGATVLPGFNDAHLQLVEGGFSLDDVDLAGAATLEEVGARLRDYVDRHPESPWVVGRDWDADAYNGVPTRQQLDTIVPDRPAYVISDDGLRGWANTPALREAGITPRSAAAPIEQESRTADWSGQLQGAAHAMMLRALPAVSPDGQEAAVRAAIREAHQFGITSVQDFGAAADRLATFDRLRTAGDLPLRVYAALPVRAEATDADVTALDGVRRQFPDDPVLKAGPATIDVNSALPAPARLPRAARNAAPAATPELDRLVTTLDRRGWQLELHAESAAAVRASLDALQQAAAANTSRDDERRHRIEGVEAVDAPDALRFAAADVLASLQPAGALPGPAGLLLAGPRGARATADGPLHQLQEAHARIVLGSHWPALPLDPRFGLDALLARARTAEAPNAPERERGMLAAAIDAYTASPAWASFDEQRKGALAPDMLADIVILSSDIFAEGARVLDTVVDTTIFDGRIVYSRSAPSFTD